MIVGPCLVVDLASCCRPPVAGWFGGLWGGCQRAWEGLGRVAFGGHTSPRTRGGPERVVEGVARRARLLPAPPAVGPWEPGRRRHRSVEAGWTEIQGHGDCGGPCSKCPPQTLRIARTRTLTHARTRTRARARCRRVLESFASAPLKDTASPRLARLGYPPPRPPAS